MAPRFEIVDEEHIEELNDKNENENTSSTEYWKNLFKKLANERHFQANGTMSSTKHCRSFTPPEIQ